MEQESSRMDYLLERMHAGVDLFSGYDPANIIWGLLAMALGVWLVAWFLSTPGKGKRMGTSKRQEIAANIITKAFDDAFERGEITSKARKYWYNRIGKGANIPDLLPLKRLGYKLHPYRINQKKEEIKRRVKDLLQTNGKEKKPFYKTKAPIPEPAKELPPRERLAKLTKKAA